MIFVDTNYFLRFLIQDNKSQYLIVKKLFLEAARSQVKLITSNAVFFEVAWVLEGYYGKDKPLLVEKLFKIVSLNVELEERVLIIEALNIFLKTNLELIDCYNLIFSIQIQVTDFKTFDQKLNKAFINLNGNYE